MRQVICFSADRWRPKHQSTNVGGGLPPIAVCQSLNIWLMHRHRGMGIYTTLKGLYITLW